MSVNQINVNAVNKRTRTERTKFEQKAYEEQFRKRNRVSGPELGQTPDITETRADRHVLFSIFIVILFVILLLNV